MLHNVESSSFSFPFKTSHYKVHMSTADEKYLETAGRNNSIQQTFQWYSTVFNCNYCLFIFRKHLSAILQMLTIWSGPLSWGQSVYRSHLNDTVPQTCSVLYLHELEQGLYINYWILFDAIYLLGHKPLALFGYLRRLVSAAKVKRWDKKKKQQHCRKNFCLILMGIFLQQSYASGKQLPKTVIMHVIYILWK